MKKINCIVSKKPTGVICKKVKNGWSIGKGKIVSRYDENTVQVEVTLKYESGYEMTALRYTIQKEK